METFLHTKDSVRLNKKTTKYFEDL